MKELGTGRESKNEKFVLENIFKSNQARILDFLILNDKFDYSFADISKYTGISLRSLQRIIPTLASEGMIKKTRESGKNFMYVFNKDTEIGKTLELCVQTGIKNSILRNKKISSQRLM
jgi:hypothetical protein